MPTAPTVRPPREGPIMRQRRESEWLGVMSWAWATDGKAASEKTSVTNSEWRDMEDPSWVQSQCLAFENWSMLTPKGSHSLAQGRAAHPGNSREGASVYPEGVAQVPRRALVQPLRGRGTSWTSAYPGCAARPWAVGCDPFGVGDR